MSLKAKIEAVIYASEEPVTLAQLVSLLGEEAQAELDALEANQPTLGLDLPDEVQGEETDADTDDEDQDALNAEVMDTSEVATEPASDPGAPGFASETREEPAPLPDPKAARLAARKLRDYVRSILTELVADYTGADRGFEVVEVAGGFRLRTKPEYHDAVRGYIKSLKPPLKLTLQALETLAVIAYKQPVTAPEITEIRGVDSAGTIGSLMARKLVTTAGRKQVIGRPMLYKTTKDFLLRFGLKDIAELPSIEEFEKMAGELNDVIQEEIQMDGHAEPHTGHEENAVILSEGHNPGSKEPDAAEPASETTELSVAEPATAE